MRTHIVLWHSGFLSADERQLSILREQISVR